jgi:rubrerythrin
MADSITARSIVEMAIDLEKTGEEFYEAMALGCGEGQISTLCKRLAGMEARHGRVFANIARQLPKSAAWPSEEETERLHQVVKNAVIPKPTVVSEVALHGKLADALAMAIRMEQDSVSFYEGIALAVGPDHKDAVEQIIREEEQHVKSLQALRM